MPLWVAHASTNCDNIKSYTPGTAGGPGGRDRTLAVKKRKNGPKSIFCCNIPGTAGGPGNCDRTLAVQSQKIARKSVVFFVKK